MPFLGNLRQMCKAHCAETGVWLFGYLFEWFFPHSNLQMLEAFLVSILASVSCEGSYGWSSTIISLGALSVNFVSQISVGGVRAHVRILACGHGACWELCVVVGLALLSTDSALLRFLLLFFFLSFVVFWEWMWANLNLKISLDFDFGASDIWLCCIRVHEDSIDAESHCILAVVFMGEELKLGPVMQTSIMAVSTDRKPEGKSFVSGHTDSGVCCHTHLNLMVIKMPEH